MMPIHADTHGLLILPRLQVQNANAISGPFTWGFPSPTAFTGFAHALQRRLMADPEIRESGEFQRGFGGVGIICHDFAHQTSQPARRHHRVFCLSRHPVGRDGQPTALIEEGRAHFEITLAIAVRDELSQYGGQRLTEIAQQHVQGMRLAGGSPLPRRSGRRYDAQWWLVPDALEEQIKQFRRLRRQWLPGFVLVQREDRLAQRLAELRVEQPDATALDALLDLCRLNIEPAGPNPDKPSETRWELRKRPGWLVPIPIGYAGISPCYPAGHVRNARDPTVPFQFVESLYSLGEWIAPSRLNDLQHLFWYPDTDTERGLYHCINRYSETLPTAVPDGTSEELIDG